MNALKITLSLVLVVFASNFSTEAGAVQHRTINFYGHNISVAHDANMDYVSLSNLSQQRVTSLFAQYRNNNLDRVTHEIHRSAVHFGLDDAGTVLLIDKITTQNNRGRNNRQVLNKYVVLKELGYDVILTRTDKKLNVLGNLAFTPGRYVYLEYNRKRYIDLDFTKRRSIGKHIIMRDSKKTTKKIRRNIYNVPRINARKKTKNLRFNHNMEAHAIQAKSNQSVVDFLGDLPNV